MKFQTVIQKLPGLYSYMINVADTYNIIALGNFHATLSRNFKRCTLNNLSVTLQQRRNGLSNDTISVYLPPRLCRNVTFFRNNNNVRKVLFSGFGLCTVDVHSLFKSSE